MTRTRSMSAASTRSMVIGADPLPGDWDVKRLQMTETASAEPVEEEEDEVDYDEQKEALNDD